MENRINPPTEDFGKHRKRNTWIYILIIVLLLATNIYLFLQKKDNTQHQQSLSVQLQQTTAEKQQLQTEYNAALARLDNLTGNNTQLKKELSQKNSDIQQLKAKINQILANAAASNSDLEKAQNLIASLNERIDGYEKQITALKKQNTTLTTERNAIASANDSLQKKIVLAKVLHASNIRLIPINLRRGGRREVETSKARKVDLLRISFDIDVNLLTESGTKEFDIRIINPDGLLLSNAALGSGSFTNSKGKTVFYSLAKKIPLTSGIPLKGIDVDWRQSDSYEKGPYIVEIYSQGHLIGQSTLTLR